MFLTVTGRATLPGSGVERLYAGETIGWDEMYARTAPLFETGAERYAWLNSAVTIGVNEFSLGHIPGSTASGSRPGYARRHHA